MLTPTLLVLLAGLIHASWNLISRRTKAGADFVLVYSALSCLLYAPVAWYTAHNLSVRLTPRAVALLALSGVIHFIYAVMLQKGYQHADLAIVYPTARGTGPLLSSTAAILLLGEKLTASGLAGALLVVSGIALVSVPVNGVASVHDRTRTMRGLSYGLVTGLCIACYTIVDAVSVTVILLPPVLVDFLSNLTRTAILFPALAGRRSGIVEMFRKHRTSCLLVAFLQPLSYIIVLSAMRLAPVSHIAPMREVSVLFGVLGAGLFLGEPFGWKRVFGAAAIAAGVVFLTRA